MQPTNDAHHFCQERPNQHNAAAEDFDLVLHVTQSFAFFGQVGVRIVRKSTADPTPLLSAIRHSRKRRACETAWAFSTSSLCENAWIERRTARSVERLRSKYV